MSDRPRLLVAVPAAHERLKLVAALRDAFEMIAGDLANLRLAR